MPVYQIGSNAACQREACQNGISGSNCGEERLVAAVGICDVVEMAARVCHRGTRVIPHPQATGIVECCTYALLSFDGIDGKVALVLGRRAPRAHRPRNRMAGVMHFLPDRVIEVVSTIELNPGPSVAELLIEISVAGKIHIIEIGISN